MVHTKITNLTLDLGFSSRLSNQKLHAQRVLRWTHMRLTQILPTEPPPISACHYPTQPGCPNAPLGCDADPHRSAPTRMLNHHLSVNEDLRQLNEDHRPYDFHTISSYVFYVRLPCLAPVASRKLCHEAAGHKPARTRGSLLRRTVEW